MKRMMLKGKDVICKGTSQSHDVLVLQPAFVSFVHKPLQKREAPASGRGLMVVPIVWWERMRTSDSSALGQSLGLWLTYCEHQGMFIVCAKDLVKDSFLSLIMYYLYEFCAYLLWEFVQITYSVYLFVLHGMGWNFFGGGVKVSPIFLTEFMTME